MNSNYESLISALADRSDLSVADEKDCISITNDAGLEVFLSITDSQILVESILFPASSVKDVSALNDQILRTVRMVPLSSVSLNTLDGEDYYVAFGALSSASKMSVIVEEIDMLFANVDDFIELYADNLKEVV